MLGLFLLVGCSSAQQSTLELPAKEQVSSVELAMVPAVASVVTKGDSNFVEELLADLATAKSTKQESVNDKPVNAENIVSVTLVADKDVRGYFYQKDGKYYFEIPYNGIWEIDQLVYNKYYQLTESEQQIVRMVRIDGKLFFDVNRPVINGPTCGTQDGLISSTVASDQIPTEDNQSNFGVDYQWQYGGMNVINIMVDDGWMAFEARD